ncbi:MAG: BPSS1780 family membrane protein [Cytophagales bacterium]|nr:BPSS1780 family membrane protein [Cytophagales bacterium]
MKLNILPARAGYLWVKSGFSLFAYKPAAFIGFFTSFMLMLILLGSIPYVGSYLSMLAFPALTLGMMAVGNECVKLKNSIVLPMTPPPMLMAWLTIRRAFKALVYMGIWFAFGFALVLLMGALLDDGEFAKLYMQGGGLSQEIVQKEGFLNAALLTTLLYFPLVGIFWFAPALMNWKQLPLSKSLFFSAYAVYKNWRAFGVYVLVWSGVFAIISGSVLFLAGTLLGGPTAGLLLMPLLVTLSTIFMASTFPTFVDCFQHQAPKAPSNQP